MRTSLDKMAVFAQVVESRGFSRAAAVLGMPKSSVSRAVADIEEALGARLLNRTTRSLSLTHLGTLYYEQCARMIAAASEAERVVDLARGVPRGRLRITAPVAFGTEVLPSVLRDFVASVPLAAVEVHLADSYVDIVGGGFDLAIRVDKALPDSSLMARPLAQAAFGLCASPEYLQRSGVPRAPRDLAAHDCVVVGGGPKADRWSLLDGKRRATVQVRERIRVNNVLLARTLCEAGIAIAPLPPIVSAVARREGRLLEVLSRWRTQPFRLFAVYPARKSLSAVARAFLDMLEAALRD